MPKIDDTTERDNLSGASQRATHADIPHSDEKISDTLSELSLIADKMKKDINSINTFLDRLEKKEPGARL